MAFRELVLDNSHAMYRLAWRLTCDDSAADDIVQEAFIKEIANILDLTTSACKQAVFRAVKKMRIELNPLVTT